jgi:hypothetical protein
VGKGKGSNAVGKARRVAKRTTKRKAKAATRRTGGRRKMTAKQLKYFGKRKKGSRRRG